jgi:hypothetical protein
VRHGVSPARRCSRSRSTRLRRRTIPRRPRESLRPEIPVDLAAPSAGPRDPVLYQALKAFEIPKPAR